MLRPYARNLFLLSSLFCFVSAHAFIILLWASDGAPWHHAAIAEGTVVAISLMAFFAWLFCTRRVRFRVWFLLSLTACVGIVARYATPYARRSVAKYNAIARVSEIGGQCVFMVDEGAVGRQYYTNEAFGGQLSGISLNGRCLSEADLQAVALVGDLRSLSLISCEMPSRGPQIIASLPNLEVLALSNTQCDDEAIKSLAVCRSLKYLYLRGTRVTDDGAAALGRLKTLRQLDLSFTHVRGDCLGALSALAELQTLELEGTDVTDQSLDNIATMRSLQTLNLSRTRVTDAGLKRLAVLPSLVIVMVEGTLVTNQTNGVIAAEEIRLLSVGN